MWRMPIVAAMFGLLLFTACQRINDSSSDSSSNPFDDPCSLASVDDVTDLLGETVHTAKGSPVTSGENNQGYKGTICRYDTASGMDTRDVIFVTLAARDDGVDPAPTGPQDIEAFCVDRAFLERTNVGTPEAITTLGATAYHRSSTGLYFVREDYCVNVDAALLFRTTSQERTVELDLGELIADHLSD
jgi:hypothetical protein